MPRTSPLFAFTLAVAAMIGLWVPTLAPVEARPASAAILPALA